jgi:hypothetical protein
VKKTPNDSFILVKLQTKLLTLKPRLVSSTYVSSSKLSPKGFRNKFYIQTGLPEEYASPFNDAIKKILKSSSLSLMSLVKSAEEKKLEVLQSEANFIFSKIDDKGEALTKTLGDFRTKGCCKINLNF